MAISGSARALALAVALTAFASSEASANLVRNNSFEDDGLPGNTLICPISDWNGCTGINAGEAHNIDPILAFPTYLAIGTVGSLGYVSQDIATTIGQKYRFSFEFSSDGDASNRFQALWGGTVLMDVSGTPFNPGWSSGSGVSAQYSFDVTATSAVTTISFGGQGNAGGTSFVGIDDVSVTAAPEPGSFALLGSGLIAVAFVFRPRRR